MNHPTSVHISPKFYSLVKKLTVAGGAVFLLGLFFAPGRAWLNFFLVNYYALQLGLAAILFLAIHYVSGAGWHTAFRRVPEAMTVLVPLSALGLLAVWLCWPAMYSWAGADAHVLYGFKGFWLNYPFFLVRSIAYLLIWIVFIWVIIRNAYRLDRQTGTEPLQKNRRLSGGFLVAFAVTFSLASFDWIMSLEPEWYSTMFGVYQFSGLFTTGMSAIVILAIIVNRRLDSSSILTEEHLHDLVKLRFSFSTFWMYIWFSQYMLIWYANLPEETTYFVKRMQEMWGPLFVVNLLLNWAIPFFVLLPRHTKRNPSIMLAVSVVVLVGHWLDLYLMIMPEHFAQPVFGVLEVGLLLFALGGGLWAFFIALQRKPVMPQNDPYLEESLHYHQ